MKASISFRRVGHQSPGFVNTAVGRSTTKVVSRCVTRVMLETLPELVVATPDNSIGRRRPNVSATTTLNNVVDSIQRFEQERFICHAPVDLHERLEALYDELEEVFYSKRGYSISPKEQRMIEATGGSPTYGELLPAGIDNMLDVMLGSSSDPNAVFVDLGSGIGRICAHTALARPQQQVKRVIGIELSGSRHEQAEYVLERLQEQFQDQTEQLRNLSRIELINEDVLTSPAMMEASHVFMCSTAFGAVACRRIVEQLHESNAFSVLITSRELPLQPYLIKLGEFSCETSWNLAGTGHVYVRADLQRAPAHLLARYLSNGGMVWLPGNTYTHLACAAQEPIEGWTATWLPLQLQTQQCSTAVAN